MTKRKTSNFAKFRLLMWKNWLLQWRHKLRTAVEILAPVIFSAILVIIRGLVDPTMYSEPTTYQPLPINDLGPLQNFLVNRTTQPILNWTILYTPQNAQLHQLVNGAALLLDLDGAIGVDSPDELDRTLIHDMHLVGLRFHHDNITDVLPSQLEYSVRFPSELRTYPLNPSWNNRRTDLLFPRFDVAGPRNRGFDNGGNPPSYHHEGFLAIQNAIADQFLQMKSNTNARMPEINVQRYPYPPFLRDTLLLGLETLVSLIILLSFVFPFTNTVKFIAVEKEKQLKEWMKIMGLPNWLHWIGWFVRTMIVMTISLSLMVFLLNVPWYPNTNTSVFTNSDWSCIWIFLFVFCMATTTFSFMLSVFFSKANTAAAISGLIWFIFYAVYSFTIATYSSFQLYQKMLLSLLSNTAMAFGFQIIIRLEGTGEGLQWNNFWRPVSVDDDLSIGLITVMLLVCTILYLVIALYFEKILPSQFGVPQPWYFPFTKQYWCGQSSWDYSDEKHSYENPDHYEDDPPNLNCGIKTINLRKMYNRKKVAVEGLTINMFDDQITVLLGHNGAGKTTTMSMLTGMMVPSSGTAIINGKDIRREIDGVRSSLGLCPQHNILFDELTVREHIAFFSELKGLTGTEVKLEVEKYVKLIDLMPKMNAMSKTLSGGMKRKLCVCIALCGQSKVVLLDEPTSGMDPASRRALWDVIREEKRGRTLLLSTHFMDEADILGDRIAIMSKGELKCVGSSHFLKKKFGNGYHLICVKKPTCVSENVTRLLQRHIPDIRVNGDIGTELSYQLAEANSKKFHSMFKELENRSVALGVDSYGISLTTLEEVFMKVGSDSATETNEYVGVHGNDNLLDIENSAYGSKEILNYAEEIPLLTGVMLLKNQTVALFKKKILINLRNWLLLLIQFAIPVLFIVITVVTQRALGWFQDLPRLKIWLQSYLQSVTVLESNETDETSLVGRFVAEYENQLDNVGTNSFERIDEGFEQYILRISLEFLLRVNSQYMVGATINSPDNITAWFNNQGFHTAPLSISLVHNAVFRAHLGPDHGITVYNDPLPYSVDTRLGFLVAPGSMGSQISLNIGFAMAFVSSFYVLSYIKERMIRSKLLQFVSGANVLTFWITAYIWDMFTFMITAILMIITFAAFQEEGWSTALELSRVFLILFAFIFAILPVTFLASKFFKEPADGFSILSLIYIVTGIAFYFIVFIMSLEYYDLQHVAEPLTWVFLLFPHFALSNGLGNLNVINSFNQICDIQCDMLPFCNNRKTFCELAPIMNLSSDCCTNDYFDFADHGIGRHLLYLFVVGTLVFTLLLLHEYGHLASLFYSTRCCFSKVTITDSSDEPIDSNVMEEKEKVQNMSQSDVQSYNLVVNNMGKAYGNFVAVSNMCIAVDQSECFGLLGVNGAGKTSAFKMLTGDEIITQGEVWIRGLSLKNEMNKIRKIIGYCPQFDALILDMTGRETLEMYCLLRGIPTHRIKSISMQLAADLNFLVHIDKKVKEYSGGNKRKLSTAVSLIGNPAIVYFDEPTTGMDPGAKRQLWDMVSKIRSTGKSIVLTSHLMDECEALCTRLAIMVNGEFKCLGSVQHLKNKFSKGYNLTIKVRKNLDSIARPQVNNVGLFDGLRSRGDHGEQATTLEGTLADIKEFVKVNFFGAELKEEYMGLLTYFIPKSDLKWSTMFQLMENAKDRFSIEDYSLSQTSLEQVFLSFAQQQKEEKIERRS